MYRSSIVKLGRVTSFGIATATRGATISQFTMRTPFRVRYHRTILAHPFSTSQHRAMSSSPPEIKPASITTEEYHHLADTYLDAVLNQYEEKQDEVGDIDVEFSSGVMTVKIPGSGVYIINKQPPNKQIWLSSPVSGPKRFDYVIVSEGQDQKQDTGKGEWIYIRTGEKLSDLLLQETGVAMEA
ncbi:mitochondrial chaperone Frataxin [Annulohypoxylon truncatum]|uniref:mitochondrial chaperone Frataxin n=1 Tax=Annulohypoxylon truncatum TaxID=327061 RepID=UPI0020085367|nr:mitochondrial chaperone Frataxin [Annulohypoxylon truncatum]KAI1206206.1 mitochondrial chaperone Frataxin [Annulohypoxylon truncatum]